MPAIIESTQQKYARVTFSLPLKPICPEDLFHHFEIELEGAKRNINDVEQGLSNENIDCFVASRLSSASVDAANAAERFNDVISYVTDLEQYSRLLLGAVLFFQSRCDNHWNIVYKPLNELPHA